MIAGCAGQARSIVFPPHRQKQQMLIWNGYKAVGGSRPFGTRSTNKTFQANGVSASRVVDHHIPLCSPFWLNDDVPHSYFWPSRPWAFALTSRDVDLVRTGASLTLRTRPHARFANARKLLP